MFISSYITICRHLISAELMVFRQLFVGKCIDLGIWVVLTVVVVSYIMPYFGLSSNFGLFQFAGALAATGLFELYGSTVDMVSDFEGDRVINYYLTLPFPSWLALLSKAGYYFIVCLTLVIVMLPLGKLCLWHQLDLHTICYSKLALALIIQSFFYGCFVILVASLIDSMSKLGSVWARFVFPLWFMGGFQFSWMSLYATIPWLAFINLVNPMVYVTESLRVAVMGQQGNLNFWLCQVIIIFFAIVSFVIGLRILRKRLDFV